MANVWPKRIDTIWCTTCGRENADPCPVDLGPVADYRCGFCHQATLVRIPGRPPAQLPAYVGAGAVLGVSAGAALGGVWGAVIGAFVGVLLGWWQYQRGPGP